eukprot:GHVU01033634.1.p3 GENE.GHVU01033634.1~~GHVU01033634.1.p3  ORF type:complete len:128 (+),score=7.49 GHVU01033634.1:114-497(+)
MTRQRAAALRTTKECKQMKECVLQMQDAIAAAAPYLDFHTHCMISRCCKASWRTIRTHYQLYRTLKVKGRFRRGSRSLCVTGEWDEPDGFYPLGDGDDFHDHDADSEASEVADSSVTFKALKVVCIS